VPRSPVSAEDCLLQFIRAQSEVKARFAPLGVDPRSDSPAEFATFIKMEVDRYAAIARIAAVEPE
jgi:tripartite-type tricarboxylate transporter receptor subunit TctC